MTLECPELIPRVLISDNAFVAAQISCMVARKKSYFPVLDGPRMSRPDAEAEAIRRTNAAARVEAKQIILSGISAEASAELLKRIPRQLVSQITPSGPFGTAADQASKLNPKVLLWGRNKIGIGLLKALRTRSVVAFSEDVEGDAFVASESGHVVVCEGGNDLSQVIAANYAYAMGASLYVFPEPPESEVDELLDCMYSIYDQSEVSPSDALDEVANRLRSLVGPIEIPPGGSVTFITGSLPYGYGFPEVPTTHLFKYPDLGIAIANGLAAGKRGARRMSTALFLDPSTTDAAEILDARKALLARGFLLRENIGPASNVYETTMMIDLFPYDFLLIATHCGDAPGWKWTYDFTDREGLTHEIVVEKAIGVGRKDYDPRRSVGDDELLEVMEQTRFVSIDGTAWNDPRNSESCPRQIKADFLDKIMGIKRENGHAIAVGRKVLPQIQPKTKETIPRVPGAVALRMFDNNYLPTPQIIAGKGSPIILNNACTSWHNLAGTFTFAGARAYVGTLIPISTTEAQEFTRKFLDRYFGKWLPVGVWRAMGDVYPDGKRRPYVMTGVFTQRLTADATAGVPYAFRELVEGRDNWKGKLKGYGPEQEFQKKKAAQFIDFYDRQLAGLKSWMKNRGK